MRFKTFFYGGMELDGKKGRTLHGAIANAALPNIAIVPLRQQSGSASASLVARGDIVKENMPVGREGDDGAVIHSPIPGIVQDIREIRLADGRLVPAVVIELSGGFDRTGRSVQHHDWQQLPPEDLIAIIGEMGVSGMGHSATPTHLALQAAKGAGGAVPATQFIVNAMESEPYQTADIRLLVEKTAAIIEGIRIIQYILGGVRTTLALSAEYRHSVSTIRRAMRESPVEMHVQVLPAVFPQGDERLLSQTILHSDQERSGPDNTGELLVLGVASIFAVYEAVVLRKPLTERVVTIAGDAVNQALNLRVRVGTPISWLIEECGGLKYVPERIVVGGPLTGRTIQDPDTPVTKETCSILALGQAETNQAPALPCMRCGACVRVCPSGLQPLNLAKLVCKDELEQARADDIDLCSECGLCSFACPSRVPLVRIIREGKAILAGHESELERKTLWPSQVC